MDLKGIVISESERPLFRGAVSSLVVCGVRVFLEAEFVKLRAFDIPPGVL